ncbi:hypothetical protein N7539_003320 [Penicillium diatomitis]|uniref:Uncharacterized protein n=1 Tax=Penicillium diatomitis TaxID=2819901 RepID=A0A9W9XH88_9EURO|nr:uncharacterized protein N7539_003320 [Penicillium diatomitis]KAJ5491753.1 hypothetical protein N7539_003320 [Penicillium diatomitis]
MGRARQRFPGFEQSGGIWITLDPGQPDAYDGALQLAQRTGVDVLVNNAGFAFIGGVEDTSEEEVRSQKEVNVYAPLRVVRTILPQMRQRRAGEVVLISSDAGFIARPGRGTYSASKFAIEAIHESLSHEVQKFGIRVLIVAPGAFGTSFASRIVILSKYQKSGGYSEDYQGTSVQQMVDMSVKE